MISALTSLGAKIEWVDTQSVRVFPLAVSHPYPADHGTPPVTIDCGLAGTVMRFVPALTVALNRRASFFGDQAATSRPKSPLLSAFASLGVEVSANRLPFALDPTLLWTKIDLTTPLEISVDSSLSSQFVSALLLSGSLLPSGVIIRHVGAQLPSQPHIAMTVSMMRAQGVDVDVAPVQTIDGMIHAQWHVHPGPVLGTDSVVAPDLTTAAVFLAGAAVAGGSTTMKHWPQSTNQPGAMLPDILRRFGADVVVDGQTLTVRGGSALSAVELDLSPAAELVPVVAGLAVFASGTTTISGVGHIRGHETDRLAAIETQLRRFGVDVVQTDDGLQITGTNELGSGVFACYDDHRMAHLGALLGLKTDVVLDDVECTSKTLPDFPQMWIDLVSQS